ncbi:LysR substrate-binding domain-containing protein [Tabrizicola sp.]|uniref:LysR substrate-binding domain-containing protein n=1 Tax=Tabrizicola sp. TaxID=2005166 RepID=UPI002FDDBC33
MSRRPYDLPSLKALAAFEAVARQRNVTHAAAELNVTPGAVSRQVRQLEADLGATLMLRRHDGISMTREGEAVAASLSEAFLKVSTALQQVRESDRHHVAILSNMATMQLWLMPRLGAFWRQHQDIVVEHVISERRQEGLRPDIDLSLRYGDGNWPGEHAARVQDETIMAVASPGFLAAHPVAGATELAAAPLLSVEGPDWDWMTWDGFLQAAGAVLERPNIRRFNSYVIALQAALDGQGIALGWSSSVKPLIAKAELVQVTTTEIADRFAIHVTWSSSRPLRPEAEVFRDWLLSAQALS